MRHFLAVFFLVTLASCAPINYQADCKIDPTTGAIVCSGGVNGTFKNVTAPTISRDPCAAEVRSIRSQVNEIPVRSYGRVMDAANTFRSIQPMAEVVDIRSIARAVRVERETVAQNAKYDMRDLKERNARENHNGKIVQNSVDRSMLSWIQGNIFGHHPKPQPLPLCAAEIVPIAPIVDTTPPLIVNPPVTLPDVQTNSDGSFSIPPSDKKVTQHLLEDRVIALEIDVAKLRDDSKKILAILESKK